MKERQSGAIEGGHGHRWFLVLDGSRGKAMVQRVGRPGYDAVRSWDAPEARLADHLQGGDRPGRAFPAAGSVQRSGMDPEDRNETPKGQARHDLLHRIAQDAVQALRQGAAGSLVLVAPAPLLATLRGMIPPGLHHAIAGEQAGDWTQLPTEEVFARLDALRRGG
jgi:protein required for attachment to host cells